MASRITTILRALLSSTDDPFLLVNQAIVQLSGTRQSKKLLSVFMFEEEDRCVHSQLTKCKCAYLKIKLLLKNKKQN